MPIQRLWGYLHLKTGGQQGVLCAAEGDGPHFQDDWGANH